MANLIEISPVTRIEGHAKITINLDVTGKVSETFFSVNSFRGFERFLQGAPVERLPAITARICGICYTAHHIASVRAIENAWGVKTSETTKRLRKLLLLGQFIESHALSLSVLSLPDLLYPNEKPENRNVQYLLDKHQELVKAALILRQAGSRFTAIIGRRQVHPIAVIIGGMVAPISADERKELLEGLEKGRKALDGLRDVLLTILKQNDPQILGLGNIKSSYLSLHDNGKLAFDEGVLKLIDEGGTQLNEFSPADYFKHMHEEEADYSFMKFPKTADGKSFRVGPLARHNVATIIPTPEAKQLSEEIATHVPGIWHSSMLFHYARLVELFYAWETAKDILNDESILATDVSPSPIQMKAAEGTGVIEAPRGTLVHNYKLTADGFCEKARFVVATQHNNLAINDSLHETATRLITGSDVAETELNKLETIVRAYDPCLSCATHVFGKRYFLVELKDSDGKIVRKWS